MSHEFFSNKSCKYYPCHEIEEINCLFCFCPLYHTDCQGDYQMINNIRDCSECEMPHDAKNYDAVIVAVRENI